MTYEYDVHAVARETEQHGASVIDGHTLLWEPTLDPYDRASHDVPMLAPAKAARIGWGWFAALVVVALVAWGMVR